MLYNLLKELPNDSSGRYTPAAHLEVFVEKKNMQAFANVPSCSQTAPISVTQT